MSLYLIEMVSKTERTLLTDRVFTPEGAEAFMQAFDPTEKFILRPLTALTYLAGDPPGEAEVTLRIDLGSLNAHVPKSSLGCFHPIEAPDSGSA